MRSEHLEDGFARARESLRVATQPRGQLRKQAGLVMVMVVAGHAASVKRRANQCHCEPRKNRDGFVEIESMPFVGLEENRRRDMQEDPDDHARELGVIMRQRFNDGRSERAEWRHQREDKQQPEGLGALFKALK